MNSIVYERFSRRQLARLSAAAVVAAAGESIIAGAAGTPDLDGADLTAVGILLDLHPDLRSVVQAARIVRESASYPITDRAMLQPLFERRGGRLQVGRHALSYGHAEQYLPDSFFPIEDERDLVCKLLIAFQRGQMQHAHEAWLRQPKREFRNSTELRSPWLASLSDYSLEAWR